MADNYEMGPTSETSPDDLWSDAGTTLAPRAPSNQSVCGNISVYAGEVGAVHLAHISLQSLVFLVGLTGNAILICIIASHRRLRSTPNFFIANLAAADCIYLMLFVPCDIISSFGVQQPVYLCKAIYFCRFLTVGVSVYTLLGLAIDRCLAITRPMSNLKRSRALLPKIGLAIIWVATALLALPYAISTHIKRKQHNCVVVPHCYPFPDGWGRAYKIGMLTAKLILYFLLPGGLISIFYSLMAYKLVRTARAHERAAAATERVVNSAASAQIEGRRKLAKLVLCLSGVFFAAWSLDYVLMLQYFTTHSVSPLFIWLKMLAKLLPTAYSASNPITLCIISRRFRAYFVEVVSCGRRRVLNRRNQQQQQQAQQQQAQQQQRRQYRNINNVNHVNNNNNDRRNINRRLAEAVEDVFDYGEQDGVALMDSHRRHRLLQATGPTAVEAAVALVNDPPVCIGCPPVDGRHRRLCRRQTSSTMVQLTNLTPQRRQATASEAVGSV